MSSTVDRITLMLGSPGRYQLLAGFLLCCIQLPATFTDHLLGLYVSTPAHRCRVKQQANLTAGESEYRPLVEIEGKRYFASCSMYINPSDHSKGVHSCMYGWEFLTRDEEWTVVTEWNLVCEREYLIGLLPYVYSIGTITGGVFFGVLADHYGRKAYLLVALILHTALGVGLHFVPSFTLFAAIYSLQGLFVTGIQCLSFVLLLETIPFPYHLKGVLFMASFWPLGMLMLSLLAWLIQNWKYIQVAVSAPGIVCIGYFWLLPRSVPWLITEGKVNLAEDQLERCARFNKTVFPPRFRLHLQGLSNIIKVYSSPSGSQHSLETVITSAKIRRYTFILYYIWFVVSLEPSSSADDVPALRENKYACLFVKGLVDLGMAIFLYFVAHRIGPRFMQATLLLFGGLLCIASAILRYQLPFHFDGIGPSLTLFPPVLSVVGRAAIRGVVVLCFFFSVKIFPTGVRGIGLGSCMFWMRTGQIVAPHISALAIETNHLIPLALCGVLSLIGSGLTCFLPSSWLRPLPNVAEEIEKSLVLDGGKRSKVHFSKQSATILSTSTVISRLDESHASKMNDAADDNEKNCKSLSKLDALDASPTTAEKSNFSCSPVMPSLFHPASSVDCPGPSNISMRSPNADDRSRSLSDSESRLTDLEEELSKIWNLNSNQDENVFAAENTRDLHFFQHARRQNNFSTFNETIF